jgi:hypothetical protein
MIGSVRQSGETACMTIGGAVNSEVFRSYVSEGNRPVTWHYHNLSCAVDERNRGVQGVGEIPFRRVLTHSPIMEGIL